VTWAERPHGRSAPSESLSKLPMVSPQAHPRTTAGGPAQVRKDSPEPAGGVTRRAVAIAFVLLLLVALVNFFVELRWGLGSGGSWAFSSGVPATVPVVVLFALAGAMGVPVVRRVGLTRRELLVIYSVVLVGAPALTHGVLAWMLVKNIAYYYTARAQPHWETMFLQHVPTWWVPSTVTAVEGFFEGRVPVPWAQWWLPLTAWAGFSIALFLCTVCLMALIQRQWITHERLTFPIAQIPLELVRSAGKGPERAAGRLPLAWAFWIGVVIALAVNFLSTLSEKIPAVPSFPLSMYDAIPWQRTGPLAGIGAITFLFWPWLIALAYLIPKELSFSVWFFTVIRHLLTVAAITAGATPMRPEDWWTTSFPAPYYQGGGAVVALAIWVLWIGRKHLSRAARIAFSAKARRQDADEPMSYRLAFLGFVVTFAFMVYFFWLSDCRLVFGFLLVALTIGYFAAWARLRAETGLGFLCFPIQIQDVAQVPFGSHVFRVSELVTLVTMRWAYTPGFSTSFEVFSGSALESFKIADAARIRARRLTVAITAGFALSLLFGMYLGLAGIYRYGWFGLSCSRGGWLGPQSIGDGGRIVSFLSNPAKTDLNGVIALLSGGGVVVALGLMRLRFWWWPFHPVGYIASNTWGSHWWYLPFFTGWVGKVLVIRYGGLRLYRKSIPFAIGLIVGDLLNGGIWAVVRLITRGHI
jgi:hypothetical protein